MDQELKDGLYKIKELAEIPIKDEHETKRVEIIMLKFEEGEVIDEAIKRIIHNTDWPFKLTIYDNRPNCANTSRIWNKLIEDATCDYVLLIDSDAYVPKCEPCWLTRMMESIEKTGIVIPVSTAPGGAHQYTNKQEEYPSFEINKDIWSGYCFLFKKDLIEKVGKFNEKYYIYGQDSEFAYRVGKIGGAVMRKDVLVEHIGGHSFKKNPMREYDKVWARELFKFHTK